VKLPSTHKIVHLGVKAASPSIGRFGIAVLIVTLALLSYTSLILALPTGPASLTQASSSRANLTSSIQSVPAEAGNISELLINANTITHAWQGYFGNISGQLVLADALGNNFYVWNGSQASGQIYASRNNAVTWTTINCTNSSGVAAENNYLGKSASEADSVNQTFAITTHPPVTVGAITLTGCPSTQAYGPANGPSGMNFWSILLSDNNGAGNIVYATIINRSTLSFRNTPTDFELLVGENGNATSLAPTSYYFYVELN